MATQQAQRRVYRYSGRVQGVGFRYTVKNIALRYDVAGYVKNLPDGRVELVVEGPAPQIDAMTAEVAQRMEGFIKKVDVEEAPATGAFTGFAIRH